MSAPIMSRFDLFFVVLDDCNEFQDYNIAQQIMKLHVFQEEAIKPNFNVDQLQRYIKFARSIKPEFTGKAALALRDAYSYLRRNDSTYSKSAYRITVRQLESLIRLSEALARVYCSQLIKKEHVEEAKRLLSNSIIKIERAEFEIDMVGDQQDEKMEIEKSFIEEEDIVQQHLQEKKKKERKINKITLTYEEFERIAKQLLWYVHDMEQKTTNFVKQAELVDWYIEQNLSLVKNEEDANQLAKIVNSVIHKMIQEDRNLMVEEDNDIINERLLRVHPAYQLDV